MVMTGQIYAANNDGNRPPAFLVNEQKLYLQILGETLKHIESCNLLGEIDPVYYGEKKQEYIIQYAMQMSQMAQSVFEKGVHTYNAVMLGDLKKGLA